LLVTLRDGKGYAVDTAGMQVLRLTGLDTAAAASLLEEHWADQLAQWPLVWSDPFRINFNIDGGVE
jgi:hypothetical protein